MERFKKKRMGNGGQEISVKSAEKLDRATPRNPAVKENKKKVPGRRRSG